MNPRNGPVRAVAAILVVGMLLSAGLAGVVAVFASGRADGAHDDEAAADPIMDGDAAADEEGRLSVAAAALIGIGITALAAVTLFTLAGRAQTWTRHELP